MSAERSPRSLGPIDAAAIAALAFIAACVSHELLGHGLACLAEGGRISVLSSVFFHCNGGGVITDLAGPVANLLLALIALFCLNPYGGSVQLRYLLALTLAFNIFWLAGCMLESAALGTSDFAYPLRVLALTPPQLGSAALGIAGALIYAAGLRWSARLIAPDGPLALPYLVAGLLSCAAALCFAGETAPALRGAALESLGADIGLLWLASSKARRRMPASRLPGERAWQIAGALASLVFVLTLGRGLVV